MATIISVHSFRGGTGKSNITANLAFQTASQGQRVGVIDTDIQSPGIHILFGLDKNDIKLTLNDYLWNRCEIEQAAYNVSPKDLKEGSIHLVPSSIKAHEIAKILEEGYDAGALSDGIEDLINDLELDYLFIDTHPGINHETLMSIVLSDILLLLMRPDKQDFEGTAVTASVARRLSVPKLYLLVNKVLSDYDFASLQKQIEQTFNAPVAAMLPLSEDVARLSSEDIFSRQYPDHQWSKAIINATKLIMAD